MVEKTGDFGEPDFLSLQSSIGTDARDAFVSSEIFRYFNQREFSANLPLRTNVHLRDMVEVETKEAGYFDSAFDHEKESKLLQKFEHIGETRNFTRVENFHRNQDTFLPKGKHLTLFAGFLWGENIYSDSMSYAVNDLPPPLVDATGYDLVFIDTPHYITVKGIDSKKIFSVVHDLIPVRDFSTNAEWRLLFMQKLKATLLHGPNMIFVSEFTRDQFKRELPGFYQQNNLIIHPTIKNDDIKKASAQKTATSSSYIENLNLTRENDRIFNIIEDLKRANKDLSEEGPDFEVANQMFEHWNPRIPYFCTALSDEPRKNVRAIVDVSQKFINKVNFVVMGKVNGNAHMGHEPLKFPNLHFAGYVSEEDKDDIFRRSLGVVFPSFAEGFGIPLVEGALYRKPIICSDIAVFREIARNNACYFDPYDANSLEEAINKVIAAPAEYEDKAHKLYPTLIERFSQDAMRRALAARI